MDRPVEPLHQDQITGKLRRLRGWTLHGEVISKGYTFGDFAAAIAYVNVVAGLAEKAKHHPDIDIRYNHVTLSLTTHDAGGLTLKDFDLARACEKAAQE